MGEKIKLAIVRIAGIIKRNFSLYALLLIFGSISLYNMENRDWNRPIRLIKDDVHQYYVYVPAVIVYHDVNLGRVYKRLPEYVKKDLWLLSHPETGRAYSKMSLGLAFIYTPFTLLAHYILTPIMNWEADGYSPSYKLGLMMSAMIFLLLGIWHLRKLLLVHFSETVTGITLAIVVLGTNLTWYSTSEATMSHLYSFTLIVVFYRLLLWWFKKPQTLNTLLTGLVFGLLVLVRPTNLVFLVLFFTTPDFIARIKFLFRNYGKIMLMITIFLLVWAPQFAFWKYVSGNWFFYTYDKESFYWNNPQIVSSLFSFRKGWLLYTPLMALSILGLPFLWKFNKTIFLQVASVLVLLISINSSWWCWWFGGSYGNRAYIDGYGLFALSIGAVIQAATEWKSRMLRLAGLSLIALLVLLNIFQTWQYRMGFIHYDAMTKQAYLINFLKTNTGKAYEDQLVTPDSQAGKKGIYYTPLELTFSEKESRRAEILRNQQYYISYYKSMARQNPQLFKSGDSLQGPIPDSIAAQWAKEHYRMLSDRYK